VERPASEMLTEALSGLARADAADTAAVLRSAWDGFLAADSTERALARHDSPAVEPPPEHRVRAALDELAAALRQAPSLPPVPQAARRRRSRTR